MKRFFTITILIVMLTTSGCAHWGLDSEADVATENCYAYRYGDTLRRINFNRAFDWCYRSAHWGDPNSQSLLAELYYLGLGGQQDMALAEQWYAKAAKQGHAHAQYMLYRLYLNSASSVQRAQAAYWLRQAREAGYKLALQIP